MAARALEIIVTRRQREARFTLMVKAHGSPIVDTVATATVSTEATLMNVVPPMAGNTFAVARTAEISTAMTCIASKAFVPAYQSEPGRREVIERRFRPTCGVVTIRTLRTVSSFVDVIGLVAGKAGTPNLSEIVAYMTGVTANVLVCAVQRKVSTFVVEFRFSPVAAVMARRAIIAKTSLMHIVRSMTVDAAGPRITMPSVIGVASVTADVGVGCVQGEVG